MDNLITSIDSLNWVNLSDLEERSLMPEGLMLSEEKKILGERGQVFHAIKESSLGFSGFGEAYFSTISPSAIKGWKLHTKMILNLVVPQGHINFFLISDKQMQDNLVGYYIKIGDYNYKRLTVSAGWWMAFSCATDYTSMLMNVASIEHDPDEAINISIADGPAIPNI